MAQQPIQDLIEYTKKTTLRRDNHYIWCLLMNLFNFLLQKFLKYVWIKTGIESFELSLKESYAVKYTSQLNQTLLQKIY